MEKEENKDIKKLEHDLYDARENILGMFQQACSFKRDGKYRYDHQCISSYETAQANLIEWGYIKREDCDRG